MSKKPKQVEPQEEQEVKDSALMVEGDTAVFDYTDTTFAPVWNETFQRYDMLRIRINRDTEECMVDKRESTRYNSHDRALHDVLKRLTNLFIKGED